MKKDKTTTLKQEIAYLKEQIEQYKILQTQSQAPIDLDPIYSKLDNLEIQLQNEIHSDGGSGTRDTSISYTDFLLPLPDHLQPTEIGAPVDPVIVAQSREQRGMNKKAAEKNRAEKSLQNKLKMANKPAPGSAPAPKFQRKLGLVPTPYGTKKVDKEE